jgi:peptide/nickel transport system substrate-binding protein
MKGELIMEIITIRKLKRLGILLMIIMLTGILVSCTSDDRSDTVTISWGNEPPHLDSQTYTANITMMGTDPIHQTLVTYDSNLNLIPGAAKEWSFPNDKTFRFVLREGMEFHNDRTVSAEDVKKSFERVMDPATGSVLAKELECVESIEVIDELTGEFKLKEPYSPFLDVLTRTVIIPIETADTQKTAPVGCGPFKFDRWEKGQYLRMTKFEEYWDAANIKPKTLIYKFYAEYASERSALLAGEVDAVCWPKTVDFELFEKNNIEMVDPANATFYYIGMNTRIEPFNDVRVRQAVKYAVDKEACLALVLEGYGDTADVALSKKDKYYDESLTYTRDVEKAKALLAEAGYPDGFEAKIIAPDTPTEGPLAEVMQQQLSEIGIKLTVEKQEVAIYIENVFGKRNFEMTICGYNATGDPDKLLYPYLASDGGSNIFGYSNSRVDELLRKARTIYDVEERKKCYVEALKIVLDEAPMTHLIQEKRFLAVHKWLKNYAVRPDLRHDFTKSYVQK